MEGWLVERMRSIGSVMRTRRPTESRDRPCCVSSADRLRPSLRRCTSNGLQQSQIAQVSDLKASQWRSIRILSSNASSRPRLMLMLVMRTISLNGFQR